MTHRGHVHNGTVILDEPVDFPEGTEVTVSAIVVENPSVPGPHLWMRRREGAAEAPKLEEFQQIRKELWPGK
jgi:hypothetical protein